MPTTTTSFRARPALTIPGIDSRSHLDGKTSMMSCGGLPTPPQSALESRRPSLQLSSMADYGSSAESTMGAFSQPATPVHGVSRLGEHHNQSWTEHAATTNNTPSNLTTSFSATTQHAQSMLHPVFRPQQAYQSAELGDMEVYADATSQHNPAHFRQAVDGSGHNFWSSPQHVQPPLASEAPTGFGPPLFAMSHALVENNHNDPLGMQAASHYHAQSFGAPVVGFQTYGSVPHHIYSQPQVVVPSQLSPHDDISQGQYHALTSPQHANESYSSSFSSYTGSLGDFEMMRPPSPVEIYFEKSDEEDWMQVGKFERIDSPSYHASMRRSAGTSSRRRGSRRARNSTHNYLHRHFTGDTEVVCQNFDPKEPIDRRPQRKQKSYRCAHIKDNGNECGVSFDRREHLKRHEQSHTDERKFPCPLPNCKTRGAGGIQRPDNAADHFKTHLRPAKKGKRNAHFDWIFVRRAIQTHYTDQKRADKLLDNLQKWIDAGMPESASQRRGINE